MATTMKAHELKPGDMIQAGGETREVFDVIRRGFDGWYVPTVDGGRFAVSSQSAAVLVVVR